MHPNDPYFNPFFMMRNSADMPAAQRMALELMCARESMSATDAINAVNAIRKNSLDAEIQALNEERKRLQTEIDGLQSRVCLVGSTVSSLEKRIKPDRSHFCRRFLMIAQDIMSPTLSKTKRKLFEERLEAEFDAYFEYYIGKSTTEVLQKTQKELDGAKQASKDSTEA